MRRKLKNKIKEYGFLAEPYIRLSRKEALTRTDADGVPSFERIFALAVSRAELTEKQRQPLERYIEHRKKRGHRLFPGVSLRPMLTALSVLIAFVLFFAATPQGRAMAGEAIENIVNVYMAVSPIEHMPKDTEPARITPVPTQHSADLTREPTAEPAETEAPSPAPTAVSTPRPTDTPAPAYTPEPTPIPTEAPTPAPALTCGAEGCCSGEIGGHQCCMKDGHVHLCSYNFPDAEFMNELKDYLVSSSGLSEDADTVEGDLIYTDSLYLWGADGITSVKGIELFYRLRDIHITNCGIEELDLRELKGLVKLYISTSSIGVVNVSGLKKLYTLNIYSPESGTGPDELYVSGCEKLNKMLVELSAEAIDLTGLTSLTELYISSRELSSLDLGKLTRLEKLAIGACRIKKLDLSVCPTLKAVSVVNMGLTELSGCEQLELRELYAVGNKLAYLDLLPGDWDEESFVISPQRLDPVDMYAVDEGRYSVDLSGVLKGRTARVTGVYGVTYNDVVFEGNFDPETGEAVFYRTPLWIYYLYDTGRGLMEVRMNVNN